jgi:protocatechuate 3,4-dioxygenase beta subunit
VGDLVLEGQVLTPDGFPAAGALVSLGLKLQPGAREATTGPDGAFSFDRMVPGVAYLGARRGDLAGGPVFHELTDRSGPVVIRLRSACRLHVHVTEAAGGTPVPGAHVRYERVGSLEAWTGPDGLARIDGVAGGDGFLDVEARGFAPVRRDVRVPEGARAPVVVEVELQAGAPLSGTVRAADGSPVEGARVVAHEATAMVEVDGPRTDGVATDREGRFELPALAAGIYRLQATHPEHVAGEFGPVRVDGVRPLAGLEIRMGAAGVVSGRVLDADGRPVPHASVGSVPPPKSPKRMAGMGFGAAYVFGHADAEGAFELRGLPRERVSLFATSPEGSSEEVEVDLGPTPRVEGVVLRLTPGGRIAGKVVDGHGAGVAEAMVSAMADFQDGTYEKAFARSSHRQVMTDGGGGFELHGLVEGTYQLRATRHAGRMDWYRMKTVESHTGDLAVILTLPEDGGLRGRVSFRDGSHPASFRLVLGLSEELPFEAPDGVFVVGHLLAGEVEVSVRGPGFAPRALGKVKIEEGKVTDLGDVQVERGRRVSGRVTDGDGRPVESALVACGESLAGDGSRLLSPRVRGGDPNVRQGRSGADGRYELGGLGEQALVVAAEHPDFGRSRPEKVPSGGGDAEVDLTLQGTGSLEGVVRVNGQPQGGCVVMVYHKDLGSQALSVRTGADGGYVVARAPAGVLSVVVTPPGDQQGSTRKEVEIHPGDRARLDFDLTQGQIVLMLQVRPLPGAAFDAAWVALMRGRVQASTVAELRVAGRAVPDQRTQMEACRPSGPCRYAGLTAGEYTACGIPVADYDDQALIEKLHAHIDERRVTCMAVTIAPAPEEQSAVLLLPSMEPVP